MNKLLLELLHDSHLTGILYKQGKEIELLFMTDKNKRVQVSLKGVSRFIGRHFLEGNVVLRAASTCHKNIETSEAFQIFHDAYKSELGILNASYDSHQDKYLASQKAAVTNGLLHVFAIEPSYGANIVAICEDVIAVASNPAGSFSG